MESEMYTFYISASSKVLVHYSNSLGACAEDEDEVREEKGEAKLPSKQHVRVHVHSHTHTHTIPFSPFAMCYGACVFGWW